MTWHIWEKEQPASKQCKEIERNRRPARPARLALTVHGCRMAIQLLADALPAALTQL